MILLQHPAGRHLPGMPRVGGAGASAAAARRLAARLLAGPSTERVLAEWCAARGLGEGPVRARIWLGGAAPRMDEAMLDALGVRPGEAVRHRRITLARGDLALADCDLWWLPGRLPPGISTVLEGTDRSFEEAAAALAPARRTVFEAILPAGGPHLLDRRAVLVAGPSPFRPVAALREAFRAALAGRPPERTVQAGLTPRCGAAYAP